jgi:hypothetical protein
LQLRHAGDVVRFQPTKQRVGKQGTTCWGSDEAILGLERL